MSDKLISADYLFAKIDKWVLDCDGISFEELKKTLNNAPAVDAVEVVRCRNCMHLFSIIFGSYCQLLGKQMDKDDYCSYGERRDENAVD